MHDATPTAPLSFEQTSGDEGKSDKGRRLITI